MELLSPELFELQFKWLDTRTLLTARLVCKSWLATISGLLHARIKSGQGFLPRPGPQGPNITMLDMQQPTLVLASALNSRWPIGPCIAQLENVTDEQFLLMCPTRRACVVSYIAKVWCMTQQDIRDAKNLRELRFDLPFAGDGQDFSEVHYREQMDETVACLEDWSVALPQVRRLSVSVPCDQFEFLKWFPEITHFRLEQDPPADLAQRCPHLRNLVLEVDGALTLDTFFGLESLVLRRVTSVAPKAFFGCVALRCLEIDAVTMSPGLVFECPNVQSLTLRRLSVDWSFLRHFPSVQELTLQTVANFGVPASDTISRLTRLTAQDMKWRDLRWLQAAAASLQTLELHELPHLWAIGLTGLVHLTELTLIKVLKLKFISLSTDMCRLRTARLVDAPLKYLCFLQPCRGTLESLVLSGLWNIDTLSPLMCFDALHSVDIDKLKMLECVTPLGTCRRLKTLSLWRCFSLENVLLGGSNLEFLRVHSAHILHADQIVLPKTLKRLSLSDLPELGHINALSRCWHLADLYLGDLKALVCTDALASLNRLQRLQWHCSRTLRFTDVGELAALKMLSLKTCDFQHADAPFLLQCTHLTWTFTSVHCGFLAESWRLTSLTFEHNEQNLDERVPQWVDLTGLGQCATLVYLRICCYAMRSLPAICNHTALKQVVLDRVPNLTDIEPLMTLRRLERAHIEGCDGVSSDQIGELIEFMELNDAERTLKCAQVFANITLQDIMQREITFLAPNLQPIDQP